MTILEQTQALAAEIARLPVKEQIQTLNEVRKLLHEVSPFKDEPVDLVLWIPMEEVKANTWNPNSVASVEMELLRLSIQDDGYTQPIVGYPESGQYEVVDGFHRNRVGREDKEIRERIHGCLPITCVNESQSGVSDRMASTIRHNRARGKHQVVKMSDIVVDLKRRGWKDEKIGKELGMSGDEVLRLLQVTGLAELFKDRVFSKAWDIVEDPE